MKAENMIFTNSVAIKSRSLGQKPNVSFTKIHYNRVISSMILLL